MPRPENTPWSNWNSSGLGLALPGALTFAEVNALKQAHASGKFSKASLARMYDTSRDVVYRILDGSYRYHREE